LEIGRGQVYTAIFEQSVKNAAGPDRINFKAIRLLWGWDEERVVALVKTTIRCGHHPKEWKIATGVVIPKQGKSDYDLAKAYRVITLQNCLGKVVEKVVATKIADTYVRKHLLHNGQFGGRKRRSAIDAVGRMVQIVEEACAGRKTVVAQLMDVKGAVPSQAKGYRIKRLEEMGFEANVRRWAQSFMSDK
jgi:hypothetical protein